MIKIDTNKCTVCGLCVSACTAEVLLKGKNEIIIDTPEKCVICGHCASVCPEDAIETDEKSRLKFIAKKISAENSEIENLLLTKRSVRDFKEQKIEKEILNKIVYYAEKSPSSSNKRQREYIIVTDKQKILELEKTVINKFNALKFLTSSFMRGLIGLFAPKVAKSFIKLRADIDEMNNKFDEKKYKIFRDAPAVIFYIAPTKAIQSVDDCIIAQQYSMLYAESIGIGSCIIGYAQYMHKAVEKVLNINKGYSVFAVSTFGYAKHKLKKEIIYQNILKTTWL